MRRALGAKRRDIIQQFLAETVVLSATGGVVGVALSFGWVPNSLTLIAAIVAGTFAVGFTLGATVLAKHGHDIPVPFIY